MPRVNVFGFVAPGSVAERELWKIAELKFRAARAARIPDVTFTMRGFRENADNPREKRPFEMRFTVPLEADDGRTLKDRWRIFHNDAVRRFMIDASSADR